MSGGVTYRSGTRLRASNPRVPLKRLRSIVHNLVLGIKSKLYTFFIFAFASRFERSYPHHQKSDIPRQGLLGCSDMPHLRKKPGTDAKGRTSFIPPHGHRSR